MPHGDAIADPDHPEFKRHASRSSYAFPHFLRELAEMRMPRYNGVERICNPDKGQFHLPIGHTQGTQERPVGCPLVPVFYFIAAHEILPFLS